MSRFAALVVFCVGSAVVLAAHPEPFTGWGLWALLPLLTLWAIALVRPPGLLAGVAVGAAYAVLYGLAAGLGDESYTDVARVVYLFLPALGLFVLLVVAAVAASVGVAISLRHPRPAKRVPPRRMTFAVGAAVIGGWSLLAATGWASPGIVVDEARAGPPPLVGEVRCDGDNTRLLTPEVRTQADGVHVRVWNASGHPVELRFEVELGIGGGGGQEVPAGASTVLVPFAADTVGFACLDERPNASAFATARVGDPKKVAREPQVDCEGDAEHETLRGTPTDNVVGAARRQLRAQKLLRRGDQVVSAVAIAGEFPVALLIRRNRSVAMVSFGPADAGAGFVATDLDFCRAG
jgi:hypothetical protein